MSVEQPPPPVLVVRDPQLNYARTRAALTSWTDLKDADTLAERLIERVGRGLPRGVRWNPEAGVLNIASDAPGYEPLVLLEHFAFVWWEEFDVYTNELDRRRDEPKSARVPDTARDVK